MRDCVLIATCMKSFGLSCLVFPPPPHPSHITLKVVTAPRFIDELGQASSLDGTNPGSRKGFVQSSEDQT